MWLFDILRNIGFKLIQGDNQFIEDISMDSRRVCYGDLFFCIPGFQVNGHDFIEDVVKKGAAAVVISEEQKNYIEGITYIQVENTRQALAYACGNFYNHPSKNFVLAGVTGTNGKTSITYFIEAVLHAWGKKAGVIGTVDTRAGGESLNIEFATSTTPDTIELFKIFSKMREQNVTHVAMEVTSHALALNKVDGICFDVGIFTNLTQDHLDLHKTMDEYRECKAKLFQICKTGIFNADDESSELIMKNATCKRITYGIHNECDIKALNVKNTAYGVEFDIAMVEGLFHFNVPVPGNFTTYNLLATIGACVAMGIPADVIQQGLSKVKGVPGRIQPVENNKGYTVIVDYSHTPDSLENIIKSVREFTKGKVYTVFGCGGDRDRTKRPIMGEIAGRLSDYCIATSDNPRTEDPMKILDEVELGIKRTDCKYEKIVDRKEAIFRAVELAEKDDTVIIAGKGHENYQIFADHTIDFDDMLVAAEALNKL